MIKRLKQFLDWFTGVNIAIEHINRAESLYWLREAVRCEEIVRECDQLLESFAFLHPCPSLDKLRSMRRDYVRFADRARQMRQWYARGKVGEQPSL
jgi:hypothetical protein